MEVEMAARLASSRSNCRVLCATILLHFAAATAGLDAQTGGQQPPSAVQAGVQAARELRERDVRREPATVYPYGLAGEPQTQGGLLAGDENKRAFIRYAHPVTFGRVVLEASTPLADEGPSTVVQLDGLANKAKVGLSIKFGDDRVPSEAEADQIRELSKNGRAQIYSYLGLDRAKGE